MANDIYQYWEYLMADGSCEADFEDWLKEIESP